MRLRALYYGFVDHIEGDVIYVSFQDPITKQDFEGEFELSKIEPPTERQHVQEGAYFRLTLRRKVTFKFYVKRRSKRAWKRICRRIAREVDVLFPKERK